MGAGQTRNEAPGSLAAVRAATQEFQHYTEVNMNALVVYESQFGNTEKVALAIAGGLRAFGQVQALRVEPGKPVELQGVELLVLGGPALSWGATAGIRSFLETASSQHLRGLTVACFDTRYRKARWLTGSAAGALEKQMKKMGISPVVPAESFFVTGQKGPLVDGELERAATWAQALVTATMAAHTQHGGTR
jgi:flavodoxin